MITFFQQRPFKMCNSWLRWSHCNFFISSFSSAQTTHWGDASWYELFAIRRAYSDSKKPRNELWVTAFIAVTIIKWLITMILVKRASSTESGVDKVTWWSFSSSFSPFHLLLSLTRIFKARVGNTDREVLPHYRINSFFGHRSFIRNRK